MWSASSSTQAGVPHATRGLKLSIGIGLHGIPVDIVTRTDKMKVLVLVVFSSL